MTMPEQGSAGRPEAFLYSNVEPDEQQKKRFEDYLYKKYGHRYSLVWIFDEEITSGFKLVVENETYDWTREGRVDQLKGMLRHKIDQEDRPDGTDLITLFKNSLEEWKPETHPLEEGTVTMVGDGIVFAQGLENVAYGEIVIFESDRVKAPVISMLDAPQL